MNTDDKSQAQSSNNVHDENSNALELQQKIESAQSQPLVELINTMQEVDTQSPIAQQNAKSMEDNNGVRIEFNEENDKYGNIIIKGVE